MFWIEGPRDSGSPRSDHAADYGCVCVVDDNGKLPESNGIFSSGSHCSLSCFLSSALFGFVALAYYLGGKKILKCDLVEALRTDYMG